MNDTVSSDVTIVKFRVHGSRRPGSAQTVTLWFKRAGMRGAVVGSGSTAGEALQDAIARAGQ